MTLKHIDIGGRSRMSEDHSPDQLSMIERYADRCFSMVERYTIRLLVVYLLLEKALSIAFSSGT
jgi:uncharacterized membrane protein YqjE